MTQPGFEAADHLDALECLSRVARDMADAGDAAGLDDAIEAAAPSAAAGKLARMYVFGARVGGDAADPDRAAMWLRGWSRAAGRDPRMVQAAVVDGVRFGERLHRALGITPGD